jgi:type VI secretion system protein ImpF
MNNVRQFGADLSILDRLILEENSYLNQFRAGLRRDLEDLLNTVIRARSIPNYLEELDQSIANFGIPDLLTANVSTNAEQDKLILQIKKIIEKNEPRLVNVTIIDTSDKQERSNIFYLRIIAETIIDNNTEEIVFDSKIDSVTGLVTTNVASR